MLITARHFCTAMLLMGLTVLLSNCSDSSPDAMVSAARQHIERDDPQGALIVLKGVVRDQPDHAPAQRLLGELYFQLGDFPLAARTLGRAVALDNRDPQLLSLYLQALIQQKQYAPALELLAAQQDPATADGQFAALLALALTGLEQLGNAADTLAAVPATDRDHPLVLYAQSVLEQAKGNTSQSIKFAKQAINAAPDNPILHAYLGDLLIKPTTLNSMNKRWMNFRQH